MNGKLINSKTVFQSIQSQLVLTDRAEARAIALVLMEKYYHLGLTDILSEKVVAEKDLAEIIERLNQHEPVQYVLGEADFYKRKFTVNHAVLIPRAETELLIHEVLKTKFKPSRILDVGTGSGCIAITLKLEIPEATVCAMDLSNEALIVAQENAARLHADVKFIQGNFLSDFSIEKVDLIVSNPPYVRESEKKTMNANVLNFEPHLALFVPDTDPLIFYKAIAEKSKPLLKPGGKVLVEINEGLGTAVKKLFQTFNFNNVQIIKDLDGKDRIVKGEF